MTMEKRIKGLSLVLAVLCCVFTPGRAWADGEETGTVTASESTREVPTEEVGAGNFSHLPFRVSATVRSGYDDNVNTSNFDRQDSGFVNGSLGVTYDFGSPRTQLSLQAGGGATYYWDRPENPFNNQDYDVNGYLGLSLRHRASARLTFDVSAYASYQTEPDFSLAMGLNRRTSNFFYTQDKFSTTYMWTPRFGTTTSYTFGRLQYEDDAIGLFEDRFENTFGNEFKFLLWPTTSLVAEYRFQLINYDHEGDVIGVSLSPLGLPIFNRLDRDSFTHFALAGIDHNFSPRLTASVRGGAEFRDYPDAEAGVDESTTSPYFETTVNYALGKTTSVSWTNRYGIEEGDVLFNPRQTAFRTGLRGNHSITPRVGAELGAYYEHDDYDSVDRPGVFSDSPGFTEEAFDLALIVRFAITRYLNIEGGYNHTEVWSDIAAREYSRNRYWGGLSLTF